MKTHEQYIASRKETHDINGLDAFLCRIDRCTEEDFKEFGMNREEMKEKYDYFLLIADTITVSELELLWYLGNTKHGESQRFLKFAKENYENYKAIRELDKP